MMQKWVGPLSWEHSWLAFLYSAFSQKGNVSHVSCRGRPDVKWVNKSELEQPPLKAFSPAWDRFLSHGHQCLRCGFHVTLTKIRNLLLCSCSHLLTRCVHVGKEHPSHCKNVCLTRGNLPPQLQIIYQKKIRLLLTLPGHGFFLNFL